MSSDEQLVDRIRTALRDEVDDLLPAPNLLELLRAEPSAAVARRVRVPARFGRFAAVLAGVAVVVVVVIVIGAVGHGRPGLAAGSPPPAGTPSTARALIAHLGVFHRSQTAADRLPAGAAVRSLDRGLVPTLTRLAMTIDAGSGRLAALRVYLIVDTGKSRTASFADVRIALVSAPPNASLLALSGGMAPTGGASFAPVFNVPAVVIEQRSRRTNLWVAVLPDGVARAKWVVSPSPESTGPEKTLFPRVKNNVAFAIGAPDARNVVSATWYTASGRVVSSINHQPRIGALNAAQTHQLYRSAHEPIPSALTDHFSIFRTPPLATAPIKPLPVYARASVATNQQAPNIDQARFVRYPGTPGFWVVPGRDGVVIATLAGAPGLSLNGQPLRGSASVLDDHMIATIGSAPPHETVFGLVPDGNPTVTIRLSDGASKTVRVIDNIYAIRLTTRPTTMTAKNASGQQVTVRVPG